jgi:hypothetical protein
MTNTQQLDAEAAWQAYWLVEHNKLAEQKPAFILGFQAAALDMQRKAAIILSDDDFVFDRVIDLE